MANRKDFNLRDYLQPGGIRPYENLPPDLEAALKEGCFVYLWSVAGHYVISGSPVLVEYNCPWSDGELWYKTAKDALDRRNPVAGDELIGVGEKMLVRANILVPECVRED